MPPGDPPLRAPHSTSDPDVALPIVCLCTCLCTRLWCAYHSLCSASGLLDAPTLICGVLAVGRVLLIMFGAAFWLIGTSAAYFVYVPLRCLDYCWCLCRCHDWWWCGVVGAKRCRCCA